MSGNGNKADTAKTETKGGPSTNPTNTTTTKTSETAAKATPSQSQSSQSQSQSQSQSKASSKTPSQPQQQQSQSSQQSQSKQTDEKQDEDSIYIPKLPNRLVITINPRQRYGRLSYFTNRARKILRSDDTLTITGVNRAISMACALVETLQRQKIATVTKIATNMNVNPNFARRGGNVAWSQPVPTIVFHLKRGEFGTYVSDFQQRKVIELFEGQDKEHTGKLSKKSVEELKLPEIFLATEEQQEHAKKFLQGAKELDLPDFIRYCSIVIHPLLKDQIFKEKLATLGIGAQEQPTANEE